MQFKFKLARINMTMHKKQVRFDSQLKLLASSQIPANPSNYFKEINRNYIFGRNTSKNLTKIIFFSIHYTITVNDSYYCYCFSCSSCGDHLWGHTSSSLPCPLLYICPAILLSSVCHNHEVTCVGYATLCSGVP